MGVAFGIPKRKVRWADQEGEEKEEADRDGDGDYGIVTLAIGE